MEDRASLKLCILCFKS